MKRLSWTLALLLLSCRANDLASKDRSDLQQGLENRLGLPLETLVDDLDASIDPSAASLLRTPIDETSAVRIALLNNREVRAALAHLGIARADLVQAGLLRNPVFDASARFFFTGGTEVELGFAQPFLDLFYRPLRQRLAEHEFAAARTMVTHELVRLAFAARRALVSVRAANQLVVLQQQALATACASHELMQKLFEAGNATDRAIAQERLFEAQARLDLDAAEMAAREAREPVQRLLGLWGPHTQWTVAGELDANPLGDINLKHLETRSISASLDLREDRSRIDSLAQHVNIESWRAWFPDAHAGVSAMRDAGGEWGLGPGVMMELPILVSGVARTDRATAALRERLQHHVHLAVEVRSAARMLGERARHLTERLGFLRNTQMVLREDFVKRVVQNYNAMQIGAFEVLRAREQQVAEERELLNTLRSAHLARLDLQELLAGSLPRAALGATWPMLGSPGQPKTSQGH